jgi:hypothetical protein
LALTLTGSERRQEFVEDSAVALNFAARFDVTPLQCDTGAREEQTVKKSAILGWAVLVMGMLLVSSEPASAKSKQICIMVGSTEALYVGKIPSRNKCSTFEEVDTFGTFPNLIASGAACLSSDGSTIRFTLADGYFAGPETIEGTLDTTTDTGSCKDCVDTDCGTGTCALVFCSGQTIPADVADPTNSILRGSSQLSRTPQ